MIVNVTTAATEENAREAARAVAAEYYGVYDICLVVTVQGVHAKVEPGKETTYDTQVKADVQHRCQPTSLAGFGMPGFGSPIPSCMESRRA